MAQKICKMNQYKLNYKFDDPIKSDILVFKINENETEENKINEEKNIQIEETHGKNIINKFIDYLWKK